MKGMRPKYPIYILSYDRWQPERRYTARALEKMNVPYKIVVEPEEYDKYLEVTPRNCEVLIMDQKYHHDFDACCPREPFTRQGSGPVRNFIWDHSIKNGDERHWVIDDNVDGFMRLNRNTYHYFRDGSFFRIMENFVDRYENIALAGPNYKMFVPQCTKRKPLIVNTRIYSIILTKNDIPFRWRARYNDDTDISLRVLKAGYATVLFNALLADKKATQTVPGGLTGQIYQKEGTLEKSKMIVRLHPDVARLVWRYGRWHHHVDYRPFANNPLIPKKDYVPEKISLRLVRK